MTKISERQSFEERALSARVQAFRRRHKRVLADIAGELGWTTSTLSRVLNAKTGMSAVQQRALRNLVESEGLTSRQDELVRLISTLRPSHVVAASQILHIMQTLGNVEE